MSTDAAGRPFPRIAIAGLGLIGGSIAAAVRARQPDVHIIGVDMPSVVDRARRQHLIDTIAPSLGQLPAVDLVVLATPMAATIEILERGELRNTDAVVTDVGSTKRQIVAAAERAGVPRFVGGHPMAGSEHAGIANADPDLFVDRPWLLVPLEDDAPETGLLARFVADLGAVPSVVDAASHDRAVAYFSHAPQLLALALMRAAGEAWGQELATYAGRAFREMTRTAASPWLTWRDILATNADNVDAALRDILSHLLERSALGDAQAVEQAFRDANDWRRRLEPPQEPTA